MMTFIDSWQTMEFIEKFYWAFAIPFSLVFIIQIIMTFFGGDIDATESLGDADGSIDSDGGIDFQFLTIKNLVAFFTIFGWTGIACLSGNLGSGLTILFSTLAGLTMMIIMATIAYFMAKLAEDGTLVLSNAIGKSGTVYLRIPANRSGMGKIQITLHGLQTLDAVTNNNEEIKTGAMVEVIDVINNEILLVK